MKKLGLFFAMGLLGLCCTACSGEVQQTNEGLVIYASPGVMRALQDHALEYFKKEYPGVAVSFYPVSEEEPLETRHAALSTALLGDNGPDVIVDYSSNQDVLKLAQSKCFYNIDELLDQNDALDGAQGYSQALLDRGKINGQRLVVPLGYNVACLISTEEILKDSGFSLESVQSPQTFCDTAIEFLKQTPDKALFCDSAFNRRLLLKCVFPDFIEDAALLKSDLFQSYMTLFQLNAERCRLLGISAEQFTTALTQLQSGKCVLSPNNDGLDLERVGTLWPVGTPAAIYLQAAEQQGVCANINLYAAVNRRSPNLQNAQNFLKILLTYFQDPFAFDQTLPANEPNSMSYLQMIGRPVLDTGDEFVVENIQNGKLTQIAGGSVDMFFLEKVAPLPESVARQYLAVPDMISAVGFSSNGKVYEYFMPYIDGADPFERCLKRAEEYLAIYMNE